MKSPINKTLDTPLNECTEYLSRCLFLPPAGDFIPDNTVVCGDFFEAVKKIKPESVDLCIADPPYNLRKDFGGEVFSQKSDMEYIEFTRKWLTGIKRVLKPTASVYICCDWKTGILLGNVLGEFFTVRNRITWQREKGRGAASNWKNSMEDIWFCTVSDKYTFCLDAVKQRRRVKAPYRVDGLPKDWNETEQGNFRLTCPSNFWDDITVPFWSMEENTAHPTQKPEKLMAKLFRQTPLMDSFSCNFNILISGYPRVLGGREILEEWTAWRAESVRRHLSEGHEALFVALADHSDKSLVKIDVRYLQPAPFRYAETTAVKDLQDGPVAHSLPGREGDRVHNGLNLLDGEHLRQVAAEFRSVNPVTGIVLAFSLQNQPVEI